jgi:hypothetical protein
VDHIFIRDKAEDQGLSCDDILKGDASQGVVKKEEGETLNAFTLELGGADTSKDETDRAMVCQETGSGKNLGVGREEVEESFRSKPAV